MEFLSLGYQRDGMVLKLETISISEVQKIIGVSMNGISLQYQFKAVLSLDKIACERQLWQMRGKMLKNYV